MKPPCSQRLRRISADTGMGAYTQAQFIDKTYNYFFDNTGIPINVLGASKRLAEQVCQLEFDGSATRLREACRLLAYTRMQVQEVGFALGFDDPAYFVRVFRQGTRLSPTEYRRKIAGGEGGSDENAASQP